MSKYFAAHVWRAGERPFESRDMDKVASDFITHVLSMRNTKQFAKAHYRRR
jgi:hypothetical protein